MNRQRLVIIAVAATGTIATLVVLAAFFELTRVPGLHYEIGWLVTLLGCGLMAWRLRASVWVTSLACAAFLVIVRYGGFFTVYSLLESGILWKVFAVALLPVMFGTFASI
jgi:hypothetical protein